MLFRSNMSFFDEIDRLSEVGRVLGYSDGIIDKKEEREEKREEGGSFKRGEEKGKNIHF